MRLLPLLLLLALAATSASAAKKSGKRAAARAAASARGGLSAAVLKVLLADEPNLRLHELGELSDSDKVRSRLYLTPAHAQAAELIAKWMRGAGLDVTVDAVGNVRGRAAGNGTAGARRWVTGSHFDTSPDAGAYDGALGVVLSIAAVEAAVAEAAVAKGVTTSAKLAKALAAGKRVADVLPTGTTAGSLLAKGVEVVAFADEEGVRFGSPVASSKALIGAYEGEGLLDRVDASNTTVRAALEKAGLAPTKARLAAAAVAAHEVEGYIEAHIEGYDKLERIGSPVGIVTHVAGATHMMISIDGPERLLTHTGSVPVADRCDPMSGAAAIILALEEGCAAQGKGSPHGVLCGSHFVTAFPNSPLNIAKQVNLTVSVTSTSDTHRRAAVDAFTKDVDAICKKRKLACTAGYLMDTNGAVSEKTLRERLATDASDALKELPAILDGKPVPPAAADGVAAITVPDLWSGPDSDALNMAKRFKTVLLHVRHRKGVTHSLAEHAEPSDVASACVVLHRFLAGQLLGRDPLKLHAENGEL